MILLVAVGFFSGIISGMGIGGGTILIPALALFSGLDQKMAQSVNLLYFIPTALVALYFHKKNHQIQTDVLKPIILFGLVGALCGAFIAVSLSAELLRKLFGGFLFVMGVMEFFKKEKTKGSGVK